MNNAVMPMAFAAVAAAVGSDAVRNPHETVQTHLESDDEIKTFKPLISHAGEKQGVELEFKFSVENISEWSPALEREFSKLAAEYALDILTEGSRVRFEELKYQRSLLKNPPSIEEKLYEIRRAEVLEKTLDALKSYVQFFKS